MYVNAPRQQTDDIADAIAERPGHRPEEFRGFERPNGLLKHGSQLAFADWDPEATTFVPALQEAMGTIIRKKLDALAAVAELQLSSLVVLEIHDDIENDEFLSHLRDRIVQGVRTFFGAIGVSYRDGIAALNPHDVTIRTVRRPLRAMAHRDEAMDEDLARVLFPAEENEANAAGNPAQ
jgi:hypothetical protein